MVTPVGRTRGVGCMNPSLVAGLLLPALEALYAAVNLKNNGFFDGTPHRRRRPRAV